MPRTRIQRIQDSVHGLMEFSGMETVAIDLLRTPELQRLRRIHQLGLAYFVFPAAEHSRFVHSLGAAHLAIRFAKHISSVCKEYLVEELLPKKTIIRDLAVAALCHDLGHGPLSHAWERVIIGDVFPRRKWITALQLSDDDSSLSHAKWHEIVGQGLLMWKEGLLHDILEEHETGFSERLRHLITGNYYIPYLPRILDSDVDVDRADYIRRDAYQSGVAYGRYDLDWLISTSRVGVNRGGQLVIGFDLRKSVRVVEQFLVARHALYETVYCHKTVRCIEGMVALLLKRLQQVLGDKNPSLPDLVRPLARMIGGNEVSPAEILSVDDFSLWVLIENVSRMERIDGTMADLAQRILRRNLFKQVPCESGRIDEFLRRGDGHERLHRQIKKRVSGDPQFYLIVDEVEIKGLSPNDSNMAYFVNTDETENGIPKAVPIREHEAFRDQWTPRNFTRLFTIQDAVGAIQMEIEGG